MENKFLGTSIGVAYVFTNDKDGSVLKKRMKFLPVTMSTAKNLEPEKDISYEGDKTLFSGKYLIAPQNALKLLWDIMVLTIIVLQGVYIPLFIAFDIDVALEFIYFDFFATLSQLIDILLSFNTGYVKKGAIVMNRNLILKHYLKSWFFVDLISTFPFDWIINQSPFYQYNYSTNDKDFTKAPKLLRVIKLTKFFAIFKLLKLAKVQLYLYRIEDYLNNDLLGKLITISRMLVVLFFIAHWNACAWYFVTFHFIDEETWLNKVILVEDSQRELYVDSMYWSIYTMISVGYGDIKPICVKERIMTIFSMVIASGLFGYLIGQASTIIEKESQRNDKYREYKKNINFLLIKYKVPNDLKYRIRNYIEYAFDNQWMYQQENDILDCLSLPLREEISHIVNWPAFQHCKIFPMLFPKSIVESFAQLFEKCTFSPFDHIIKQNEKERKMYFLVDGIIELYINQSKRKICCLENAGYFGEIGYFANIPRTANAISIGFSVTLVLDYEATWNSLEKFPTAQKIFEEVELKCKEDLSIINVKCCFCSKLGHAAINCFDKTFVEEKQDIKNTWLKQRARKKKRISNKKYYKSNFIRKFKASQDILPIYRSQHSKIGDVFKSQPSLKSKAYKFLTLHDIPESPCPSSPHPELQTTRAVKFEDFMSDSNSDNSCEKLDKNDLTVLSINPSDASQSENSPIDHPIKKPNF